MEEPDIKQHMGQYILIDKKAVPATFEEFLKWQKSEIKIENGKIVADEIRRVGRTTVSYYGNNVDVSTVFLCVDHAFGGGPPVLFETMLFGDDIEQYQWRYHTWDEAERAHRIICKALENGIAPDLIDLDAPGDFDGDLDDLCKLVIE